MPLRSPSTRRPHVVLLLTAYLCNCSPQQDTACLKGKDRKRQDTKKTSRIREVARHANIRPLISHQMEGRQNEAKSVTESSRDGFLFPRDVTSARTNIADGDPPAEQKNPQLSQARKTLHGLIFQFLVCDCCLANRRCAAAATANETTFTLSSLLPQKEQEAAWLQHIEQRLIARRRVVRFSPTGDHLCIRF